MLNFLSHIAVLFLLALGLAKNFSASAEDLARSALPSDSSNSITSDRLSILYRLHKAADADFSRLHRIVEAQVGST